MATITNAEQYLQQLRTYETQLEQRVAQAKELKARAMHISSPSFGEKVQTTRQGNRQEIAIEKYMLMYDRAEDKAQELESLKDEIITRLERVTDYKIYQVLIYRYVYYMKFEEIADKIFFSVRQVRRYHMQGLQVFEQLNQDLFTGEETTGAQQSDKKTT